MTGGLSWYGQGRGCNTLTGGFGGHGVTYSGATLTSIYVRFEQHCEEGRRGAPRTGALAGALKALKSRVARPFAFWGQ